MPVQTFTRLNSKNLQLAYRPGAHTGTALASLPCMAIVACKPFARYHLRFMKPLYLCPGESGPSLLNGMTIVLQGGRRSDFDLGSLGTVFPERSEPYFYQAQYVARR